MQEKTVLVSGKEVRFRSSAAIPRLYRIKFKRDIFKDLSKLEASYKGKSDDGEESMPIPPSPARSRSGSTNLRCFRSIRCSRRSLSSGAGIW